MIVFDTEGLNNTELYPKGSIPLFLDDDFRVIEGPSYWAIELSQKRSRSSETLKQYSTVLARFLQWRDDTGLKSIDWQLTDGDTINSYIGFLINSRDINGKPNNKTIEDYIAIIGYFFKWAIEEGYTHYWKIDIQKTVVQIEGSSALVKTEKEIEPKLRIGNGTTSNINRVQDKFIHRENIPIILELLEDVVYVYIILVLWSTGLRPKELFQLPYRGTGLNSGFKRYRLDELEELSDIFFRFESKGKERDIKFPIGIWKIICEKWMPERNRRAAIYQKGNNGKMPPNNALFISENGRIVTKKMLRDNLAKVARNPECPEKNITPRMFRHSFATYFILDRLKQNDLLGKAYVYNAVIDAELRQWMGHENIETTYKFYVHLINQYFYKGLLETMDDPINKEIIKIFEEL